MKKSRWLILSTIVVVGCILTAFTLSPLGNRVINHFNRVMLHKMPEVPLASAADTPTPQSHKSIKPTATLAPLPNFGYQMLTYTDQQGHTLTYYLYVPRPYNPAQKYPLVLLLEGIGERKQVGNTPEQNMQIMLHQNYVQVWSADYQAAYNPQIQKKWPCFVVIPQIDPGQHWVNTDDHKGSYTLQDQPSTSLTLAKELLDTLQQKYSTIDKQRRYITGLSMGGFGTWDAIERWPNYFAAAAPIAGGGDPTLASRLINLPIWAVQNSGDNLVPISASVDMISAIRKAGGTPIFTELNSNKHGGWGETYQATGTDSYVHGFYDWLFAQRNLHPTG